MEPFAGSFTGAWAQRGLAAAHAARCLCALAAPRGQDQALPAPGAVQTPAEAAAPCACKLCQTAGPRPQKTWEHQLAGHWPPPGSRLGCALRNPFHLLHPRDSWDVLALHLPPPCGSPMHRTRPWVRAIAAFEPTLSTCSVQGAGAGILRAGQCRCTLTHPTAGLHGENPQSSILFVSIVAFSLMHVKQHPNLCAV